MNKLIFFLLLFLSFLAIGQEKKERQKSITKVGVLFSKAKQNNILFFDKDYDYKTNVYKFQLFYTLRTGINWDINLIVQPQFQMAQHQLLNEQFITPDEPNYEFLREKFTNLLQVCQWKILPKVPARVFILAVLAALAISFLGKT